MATVGTEAPVSARPRGAARRRGEADLLLRRHRPRQRRRRRAGAGQARECLGRLDARWRGEAATSTTC